MGNLSFLAVSVEVVLVAGALVVLLADLVWAPDRRVLGALAGISLAGGSVMAVLQWRQAVGDGAAALHFSGMLALDGWSAFAGLLVMAITAVGLLAGWDLVIDLRERAAEFLVIVLLASSGVHLMAAASNFVVLFLGLEIASISLYVLAGYTRERADADEAALKYFLLGAFASAVFLYGVALVFAGTGSTNLYAVAAFFQNNVVLHPAILLVGFGLLIVGLGFKVSAAPFHMWAPDVYQGAPGAITGYMAAAAKIGGFAAFGRILAVPLGSYIGEWAPVVGVLAAASVVVGTVLAIAQSDIKRMLAYSSVAHAGFMLTALVAGAPGLWAMLFYLATYAFQVVGAFAVAAAVAGPGAGRSALTDYTGLGKRNPLLAFTLAGLMIAMGGTPLLAGFVGKAAVFQVAMNAGYTWLVIVALLSAVAGFFFYLRVVVLMYMQAPAEHPELAHLSAPMLSALAACGAVTVVFGIVPWPLLDVVRDALPL